jgi:hypothetical protein
MGTHFYMSDRPFLVSPRWPLFSWRECYLAGKMEYLSERFDFCKKTVDPFFFPSCVVSRSSTSTSNPQVKGSEGNTIGYSFAFRLRSAAKQTHA